MNGAIWNVTTSGVAQSYSFDTAGFISICNGPDGNLWVADSAGFIWEITTSGVGTQYPLAGILIWHMRWVR